ncbi:GatB/YqeY domain-containing protein [Sphingomonas sp. BIUV-7]|uniref:GatB/YqeY domain-containing protein n=1 Tax=Sphingomonas natans TaxID=3063330 RepID=A0ABT8Y3K4_9SPHN|nr:GatB/YqeY domain-containing protein [Sphingomonas sp. BIUV-7]MDO6412891.1 GatB/YqeY domain-containing protein [Sphingomonas sp. BIUV-7]
MIRDDVKAAQIAAMKSGDKATVAATRLIEAAVKNRDIELRTATSQPDDDLLVTEVLQKMIKQRRESIDMYIKGGRQELADAEAGEIAVIERFLPKQMSEDEARAAVDALATELGAASVKDMGRVMAALKERFAGQMDMGKASGLVKARLG